MFRTAAAVAARSAMRVSSAPAPVLKTVQPLQMQAPIAMDCGAAQHFQALRVLREAAQAKQVSFGLVAEADTLQMMNRNARKPKKANHGKRPCSHHGRRERRKKVRTN